VKRRRRKKKKTKNSLFSLNVKRKRVSHMEGIIMFTKAEITETGLLADRKKARRSSKPKIVPEKFEAEYVCDIECDLLDLGFR